MQFSVQGVASASVALTGSMRIVECQVCKTMSTALFGKQRKVYARAAKLSHR